MSKRVEKLKEMVGDIQEDLSKEKKRKNKEKYDNKERTAYLKLPRYTKMEFWCDECEIDFVAPAYKVWIEKYRTASWHSFCPVCGSQVYRYITSKKLDPYYNKSEKIRQMRGKAHKDMLQPTQYGFKSEYGDPFEHYYKQHQHEQELLYDKYAEMGLLGKTLAQKDDEDDIIRKEVEINSQ